MKWLPRSAASPRRGQARGSAGRAPNRHRHDHSHVSRVACRFRAMCCRLGRFALGADPLASMVGADWPGSTASLCPPPRPLSPDYTYRRPTASSSCRSVLRRPDRSTTAIRAERGRPSDARGAPRPGPRGSGPAAAAATFAARCSGAAHPGDDRGHVRAREDEAQRELGERLALRHQRAERLDARDRRLRGLPGRSSRCASRPRASGCRASACRPGFPRRAAPGRSPPRRARGRAGKSSSSAAWSKML